MTWQASIHNLVSPPDTRRPAVRARPTCRHRRLRRGQIPESTAVLDIDKQIDMLDEALDLSVFSDPEELNKFIERFVTIWDATNTVSDPALDLFNQGTAYGVSTNLLLTIQTLK